MLPLQTTFRNLTSYYINAFSNINRNFHSNQPLWALPLRKKKKVDPQLLKERAEKKIRRLQRDIRKLEKVARQCKPLSEMDIPRKAMRDSERIRPPPVLTKEELQERAELNYVWSQYKRRQHLAEMKAIQRVVAAQEKALDALEEVSQDLYNEAIQPDPFDTF
ncbi:39S ribosomal protein L40, mitochondrial [Caerostris extrusa]|uniref:Large ribosomal subunit protein mL40 n=1 Tax=Caerostris extrusa TaxID=172846 RepID=A0AAV4PM52_CAEEX|nr:39S ribosomal protein L40, mitochondrial [Caerostris extrusa]